MKVKTRSLARYILAADLIWVPLALAAAYAIHYGIVWNGSSSFLTVLGTCAVALFAWLFLSSWMKLDCFEGGWRFPAVVTQIFLASGCLMSLLLAGSYLVREYQSRLELAYFGLLLFLGFIAIRYCARLLLHSRYLAGDFRKVVIVGAGRVARELATKIDHHPEMLCKVVGYLFPEDDTLDLRAIPEPANGVSAVATLEVVELLRAQGIDELILALAKPVWAEVLNLAARCREHGINVSLVPQPYELYLSKPDLLNLDGLPILQLQEPSTFSPLRHWWKRTTDVVLGLVLLGAASLVLLPIAIWLQIRKGQAFRWEPRCGQHGKQFLMLRLNVDRPAIGAIPFERILEGLSVTELPQLWNVLRGDMSLVGPRPEALDRVKCYSEWERQRLSVKPGLTGLAQVHGLREHHSSEEKTRFDLQYLLNPSLLADVSLLLQTVWTLAIRLVRYPQLVTSVSTVSNRETYDRIPSHFVKESLQGAHRAQSGSD
jgi:lipopolysaccharide/colanic/teichoic acid biosynthesis glycosyltransferase